MKLLFRKALIYFFATTFLILDYSCERAERQVLQKEREAGEEFSKFGLAGLTYSEILDTVGSWHNNYQEKILNYIVTNKIDLSDTVFLKNRVEAFSISFFKEKGIEFTDQIKYLSLGTPQNFSFGNANESLSSEANVILRDLEYELNNLISYDGLFVQKLNFLKAKALDLKSISEIMRVGIPISIALHSFDYWSKNGDTWFGKLSDLIRDRDKSTLSSVILSKGCNVNLWKLGGADVVGAVSGAKAGTVLGPGGALAIGILGSAVGSTGNVLNQVMDCYFSWWPF